MEVPDVYSAAHLALVPSMAGGKRLVAILHLDDGQVFALCGAFPGLCTQKKNLVTCRECLNLAELLRTSENEPDPGDWKAGHP